MSDYTEHLISQAGGDGDDFPCCTTPPTSAPRTEDWKVSELFGVPVTLESRGAVCHECGALVADLFDHVTWHNKLLP